MKNLFYSIELLWEQSFFLVPEMRLYDYRDRYYNPEIGRFISEDPIGLKGGKNLYRYVKNNPINFKDPSGKIIMDYTGGQIPFSVRNSKIFQRLDRNLSIFLSIRIGRLSDSFGTYQPFGGGYEEITIDIDNHNSKHCSIHPQRDLVVTYIHELNHAEINLVTGNTPYSDTEKGDNERLPDVLEDEFPEGLPKLPIPDSPI